MLETSQSTPDAGVNAADATNANLLNRQLGAVIAALGDGSSAVITALGSIASAITASIIGGTTGSTADRALVSKGTTGRALQATPVSISPSTGDINTNGGDLTVDDITADDISADDISAQDGAFSATLTKGGTSVATITQTFFWSWYFQNGTAKAYRMIINIPIGSTITAITTRSESGTATLAGSINGTPLGGSSNSVSTSEVTQTHSSANVMVAGDDFELTLSSVSSLVGMTVTVAVTVTLA